LSLTVRKFVFGIVLIVESTVMLFFTLNFYKGGSTYVALASLALMGRLDDVVTGESRLELIHWLTQRQVRLWFGCRVLALVSQFSRPLQVSGFQGRPNKDPDSCYSWWIGASLHLLGVGAFIHGPSLFDFLMTCQHDMYGGFAKLPGESFLFDLVSE
jgi:geranylgeranyl transferase type-1 subunit beta